MQLKHGHWRFKSLQILHINKIFKSHFKSSQADLLYSSVLLVTISSQLISTTHAPFSSSFYSQLLNSPGLSTLSLSLKIENCSSQSHIATDGQSVSKLTRYVLLFDSYGLVFVGALSDERTGLSFVYAAGLCQRSLSRVRVPWDSRPYFTVSDLRLPFRRLLRLAGSRWRYSTQPPHGYC
jgi:hypothetical protein